MDIHKCKGLAELLLDIKHNFLWWIKCICYGMRQKWHLFFFNILHSRGGRYVTKQIKEGSNIQNSKKCYK